MRRTLVLCFLLFVSLPAFARQKAQGYCSQGGVTGTVAGLNISPVIQATYPGCTVTVYLAGTLTVASVFSDNAGTIKSNPFTADTTTGLWFWYADNGRYDVRLSSGGIPTPFTIGDIELTDIGVTPTFYGATYIGSVTINQVGTPAAPVVTVNGTPGSTTYTYFCVGKDGLSNQTLPSAGTTITNGAATPNNTVSCGGQTGALAYIILKTNTSTQLGTCTTTSGVACTVNDTGQATSVYTAQTSDQTGKFSTTGPGAHTGAETFGNINAIRWVDGVKFATAQAAVTDCGSVNACTIAIPSTYAGADAAGAGPNITIWDFRSQTFSTNPTHYAFNIWDGSPGAKWVAANTGGLARTKAYVAETPASAGAPGDSSFTALMNAFAGSFPASSGAWGGVSIIETQAGTDTLTNSTILGPIAVIAHEFNSSLIGSGLSLWDIRGTHSTIFGGTPAPSGTVGGAYSVAALFNALPATGLHIGSAESVQANFPNLNVANQNTFSGTVNTSATAVTWVSGDKFYGNVMPTNPIVINAVTYVVASVASPTSLTLTTTAGTQTSVSYTMTGHQYALRAFSSVLFDISTAYQPTYNDPQGGGGFIVQNASGISSLGSKAMWFRDASVQSASGVYSNMGLGKGTCGDGQSGLLMYDSSGTRQHCFSVFGSMEGGAFCNGTGAGCITPPTSGNLATPAVGTSLVSDSAVQAVTTKTQLIANGGTAAANANVALSAGWGTTASVSGAAGYSQHARYTITSAGTGQLANPTITVTLPVALPSALVLCTMTQVGGTQAFATINETTVSATAPVFTYAGTPVAGNTVIVDMVCGP